MGNNRGQFQAQGSTSAKDNSKLQKSRPWNTENPPTKKDGKGFLDELKKKLSKSALEAREVCFQKAERYVNNAPKSGLCHIPSKSFRDISNRTGFKKDVRVDLEVCKGYAFVDDKK